MKWTIKKTRFVKTGGFSLLAGFMLLLPAMASASGGGHVKHANITFDNATLRAGLQVFTDVCMGCHAAKYITYRNLMDYPELGLSREEVDELRGNKALMDGLKTELAPEDAVGSYGKVPPDLSVIARARRGGGDYLYSLLIGYEKDPSGKIEDGNYNVYFPGGRIAMPDPLAWMDHSAEETAALEEQSRAVSSFLVFIGDPHQLERKRLGRWVMGFLVLLTFVLWLLKKEVWKDVKKQ
ncbi:MAG: cytochrome c1 [Mariprofundaceae bacterium]|nr:cytochrome c1 [Mariprofundaceae bacterium]